MKLLLVNPPETRTLRSNLPGPIESLRGKNPPIGLLYAAAAARTVESWAVELIDAHAMDWNADDIASEAVRIKPDLVGVTATTFTYLDALDVARAAKRGRPDCLVVFGGVHPFIYPAETLAQPEVDMIIAGEAEQSLPALLRFWAEGGPPASASGRVPGLLVKGDDTAGFVPAPVIDDLDSVPAPAWDMSPVDRYYSLISGLNPVTILLSSRGCPFRCRYCALSPTGKRWRPHSAERVVEEMKICRGLGARYLLFYDELFTVRRKRVVEICDLIRKDGVGVPWMARATPDMVDADMLSLMRGAGCDMITFGVEAGNPKVLENLGRKPTIVEARAAFEAASKAGLRTIAYFMLGNPGEGRAEIDDSLSLAKSLEPDYVHASIFMPYPASDAYAESLASGKIKNDYWREFAARPGPDFEPPYWNEKFTDRELETQLLRFYRGFAFRPSFILKRLMRMRSAGELAKAFRAALKLLLGFGG